MQKKKNMENITDTELLEFCLSVLRCSREDAVERLLSAREKKKPSKSEVAIWETKAQLLVRIVGESGKSSFDEALKKAFPGLELPEEGNGKNFVLTKEPRKILSVFGSQKETMFRIGTIKNLEHLAFSEKQLPEDFDEIVERISFNNPLVKFSIHPEEEPQKKKPVEKVGSGTKTVVNWTGVDLSKFTKHPKFFPSGWKEFFEEQEENIKEISDKLWEDRNNKIVPKIGNVWRAFVETPRDSVRVVIVGQDPYPTAGNAMGLAFSFSGAGKLPASLSNIAKEVKKQGFKLSGSGDLTCWAKQGVLLLNTALTTLEGKKEAHVKDWGDFSREAIRHLGEHSSGIVYLLWGGHARKFRDVINGKRNFVLECAHPSPLSVEGFRDNNHFIRANEYLKGGGKEPIDWSF
ncbi:uracil-DNA glycosylase D4 [Marseillevirus marseillevirus]|uniref:Uracil-DNA glycosylase D4 n=1 Tax=Marseillevirus marseillevirus TaxID=694581 RepID=D2XB34_GBMV|nr:uracil-DNA glycosylase D4 [Marseillevirus marseillevirus]ADB04161.1 uracil-DNA glycosylase D4 [Marseillevirus marseillevirus]